MYGGVIVLRPPEQLSFHGEPQTRAQELELTRAQTNAILQRLIGRPIHTEHNPSVAVGHVTEAFYNAEGHACVRFELHGPTKVVDSTRRLIAAGYLRGLSLSHHRDTLEPTEVSLCFRGAREGTGLTEWPASEERDGRECKPPPATSVQSPQRSAFVAASAVMSNLLMTTSQVGQPPLGQPSANPHVTTQVSGAPSGPPRTLQSLIAPQLGPEETQHLSGQKRRRVVLPDGTQMDVTDDELRQLQQQSATPIVQASNPAPAPAPAPTPTAQAPPPQETKTTAESEQKERETREQVLRRMVENKGQVSEEDQVALIEFFTRSKRDRDALTGQVHKLKQALNETAQTDQDQVNYLLQVLVPFMRTFLGKQAVTPEQENNMSKALAEGHSAANFMRTVGPQLVQASSLAMELKRRDEEQTRARVPERLQRALSLLNQGTAELETEGLAPQQQQPRVNFASQQFGWQPTPQLVNASSLAAPAVNHRPHDPFAALDQLHSAVGRDVPMQLRLADVMERNTEAPHDPSAGFSARGMLPRRP